MGKKQAFVLAALVVFVYAFKKQSSPTPYVFPKLLFFPPVPQDASNPVTVEGVELGRYLFYDSILSANYSFSCASCHKQEHAFSDAPNTFSKGLTGELMTRNTMPLFNLAWSKQFFWDGRA
ncbi:MAG TPA: cytochrome-c peroxidase, partial [Flavobacteriales bacterium]|nr:cytochrome-c peroxidase [Flavobacteriales bacterium]